MKGGRPAGSDATKTFQGKPCKYGHTGLRYFINHACAACTKLRSMKHKCYQTNPRTRLSATKSGAKKRELCFELTDEQAFALFAQDCHYCGGLPVPLNGIDRIDSSVGYTVSNTVPCCTDCNYGKGDLAQRSFLSWVERVYKHQHP